LRLPRGLRLHPTAPLSPTLSPRRWFVTPCSAVSEEPVATQCGSSGRMSNRVLDRAVVSERTSGNRMFGKTLKRVETFHWHTVYLRLLDEDSVVLDLGANRGQFARAITETIGCTCHAVEASPYLARDLTDTDRIAVHHYAVASHDGEATFSIHASDDSSSLCTLPPADLVEQVRVPSITLETFVARCGIQRIDLIKMDIEGAEISVLDSTPDDFLASVGQLSVELHDFNGLVPAADVRRIIARLSDLGFFYVRFSRHGNEDVLLLNIRLHRISRLERFYIKYVVRNVMGGIRMGRRQLRGFFRTRDFSSS
jgi:FkbM family methyltransferase